MSYTFDAVATGIRISALRSFVASQPREQWDTIAIGRMKEAVSIYKRLQLMPREEMVQHLKTAAEVLRQSHGGKLPQRFVDMAKSQLNKYDTDVAALVTHLGVAQMRLNRDGALDELGLTGYDPKTGVWHQPDETALYFIKKALLFNEGRGAFIMGAETFAKWVAEYEAKTNGKGKHYQALWKTGFAMKDAREALVRARNIIKGMVKRGELPPMVFDDAKFNQEVNSWNKNFEVLVARWYKFGLANLMQPVDNS